MKIVTINAMWCPGCIVMHKVCNEIKEKYPDIEIISYDYDMDEEVVKTYSPGSILPITILFNNEVEIERLNGEKSLNDIIELIEKYK